MTAPCRGALAIVLCGAALAASPAAARRPPDRDAMVILPQGMPVSIEHATFFEDGNLIAVRLRNGSFDAARTRLRILVFDPRLRLKGSASYCAGQLQPGTRQGILIPLEVKGASVRDQFAVVVEEIVTTRRTFALREPLPALVEQARRAVDLMGPTLTTLETNRTGEVPECPCDCESGEALAREGCGAAGPAAFTCTPMLPGCSHGFTCKP